MNLSRMIVHPVVPRIFRIALFLAGLSLAAYIPFKYATHLHATTGLYAFLFPFSGLLALGGMMMAVKPRIACNCSVAMRAGFGVLSLLWMVAGMMCAKSLAAAVMHNPLLGSTAVFQMTAQHIFLSLSMLAFALLPARMSTWLEQGSSRRQALVQPQTAGSI